MNKKLKSDDLKKDNFWCAVNDKDEIILDQGRLPIFYLRKVAKQNFAQWKGAKIIKITVTSK